MSSPLKVVNIASTVQGVSKKIAMIRIIAIVVVVFLGLLAVGSAGAYVTGILSPLMGKIGSVCSPDSQEKITSQTGANNFTSPDQQKNAQLIINAVAKRNMPKRAAIIALATAMQESSLVNVNYGDDLQGVRNPDGTLTDSRGLFQQQHGWGTLAERLDPTTSAGLFLNRLIGVNNWQSLAVTDAAQRVQGSALPNAYAKWEARATEMVDQIKPTEGEYGTSSGSSIFPPAASLNSSNEKPCGTVGVGTASGVGDDYPANLKSAGPDSMADQWGYYNRECVSFVASRITIQMGLAPGAPNPAISHLGSAYQWGSLGSKYKIDTTPAVGAIAWWSGVSNNVVSTGSNGHVAIVSKVNDNGTVDIEQYNATPYAYSTMTIPANVPTGGYIHVADIAPNTHLGRVQ